jgi:hypothetical protein
MRKIEAMSKHKIILTKREIYLMKMAFEGGLENGYYSDGNVTFQIWLDMEMEKIKEELSKKFRQCNCNDEEGNNV